MSVVIRNARVLDPATGRDEVTSVVIGDGRIRSVGAPEAPAPDARLIEAGGLWLFPGLIDLATWLREPGLDHKATLATETRAAAASGITTLCHQPEPDVSIDSSAQVNLIHDIADSLGKANVRVVGNMTRRLRGQQLTNMGSLRRAGCVGVTNGWQPFADLYYMRRAMEYAATHDLTVFVYPLEHALAAEGVAHEGEVASRLGLPAIPAVAETVAVAQTLALLELTGARVHFCRLSAAGSVRLIRQARQEGLLVTADVAAHQLFLTEKDLMDFNSLCHVMPPLRSEADRQALLEGLQDNTIDAICSDHQPHEIDAKMAPLQQTAPGISALETLLPLSMRLVQDGVLDELTLLGKLTWQPAHIIRSEAGRIAVEAPADLVLYDPEVLWELSFQGMLSKGRNTPFAGWSFHGQVRQTFLSGLCVHPDERREPE